MASIDTILKCTGVAAVVGLGIPVGLSVKFDDGGLDAAELHSAFDLAAWSFEIRSPRSFSNLEVKCIRRLQSSEELSVLGSLSTEFPDSRRTANVRAYLKEGMLHIVTNGNQRSQVQIKNSIAGDPTRLVNLGGKGKEVSPGEFLIGEFAEADLLLKIETR